MLRIQSTFLLITVLFVSACGYHLRGSINLPEGLKRIYLSGASSQLTAGMKKALKFSGGKLVENSQQAGVVVQIVKETMETRVLSLSSTGRANEYEIIYTLKFNLLDAKQQLISELKTLEITRNYFNNQEQVLAKRNEEQIIKNEMYRNAVQSVINRARLGLEKTSKF